MIPVRCVTCGKPIAHLYEDFKKRTSNGENAGEVLADLGIKRFCCRRIIIAHVDLVEDVISFGSISHSG